MTCVYLKVVDTPIAVADPTEEVCIDLVPTNRSLAVGIYEERIAAGSLDWQQHCDHTYFECSRD